MKYLLCIALALLGINYRASAQSAGTAPPPSRFALDDNGVNLATGEQFMNVTELKIGSGDASLALVSLHGVSGSGTNFSQYVYKNGATWSISVPTASGARTYVFTLSGSTYTSTTGEQATFAGTAGNFTLTLPDGSQYLYNGPVGATADGSFRQGRLSQIIDADGTKTTLTYLSVSYCAVNNQDPCSQANSRTKIRLQSVSNSFGYQLFYSYAANQANTAQQGTNWDKLTTVTAFNLAVDYCAPTAFTCTFTQTWPSASYTSGPSGFDFVENVTAFGETTRYVRTSGTGIPTTYKVKRPGSSTDNITITLDANGRPSSIVNEGRTFGYSWSPTGTSMTVVLTNPDSSTRTIVTDTNVGLPTSVKDELNRTTSYQYDTKGRLTKATAPELNYAQYTYNDTTMRGNLTETRVVSKTPGTPADIVTTANYPTTCPNPKTCNQPSWTRDARGNQTDYTYDSTHGGVATVTRPAVITNGVSVRPQTRLGYTALQAYFKNSAGSIVASGVTAYRLTSTSACQTTASCANTADEVRSVTSYGPQTAGTANNLLPVSNTRGSGAAFQAGDSANLATTTLTYDNIGQNTFVDGPLPGVTDTTRLIYNAKQQNVGLIGPDPDGAGAMKNRAARISYNADGQVTQTERGTTNGQTDTDWGAFVSLQQQQTSYDAYARPSALLVIAGGSTYTVGQYGYDNRGRQVCVAQRMNPSIFGSLPSDGCQLGTTGSFGPDRITKTTYDVANEVIKTTSAYLTTDASDDATMTYTNNGRLQTLVDANGNKTTYEYDGIDRQTKQRYPDPSTPGVSSSTDYSGVTLYDATGNVITQRLRDGQTIGATYDNLNRQTLLDLSGTGIDQDITYGYDLLNRLTSSSNPQGHLTNYLYDALGRMVREQTTYGGYKYSQYDLAGRRTRLTWSDGFYVAYDYLVTGETSFVRENGAVSGIGVLAAYSYDNLGKRSALTRGNGTVTSYSYDPISRLSIQTDDVAPMNVGGGNDRNANFSYNPASQIASMTRDNDAYAYSLTNNDLTETPNGLNQLITQGGTAITYDGRGNTTGIGATTYSYGQRNQLSGTAAGPIYYDTVGRIDLIDNSSHPVFDFDGPNLASIGTWGVSAIQRRYVYSPGIDEPLVWYEGNGTTDRRWLYQDERGSVIAVANDSGVVTNINKYDDYGVPAPGNVGRLQYTGQIWLPEIGQYYYGTRMYAPGLGRFLQPDTVGYQAGMNLYAYVGGNPINFTDPLGLAPAVLDEIVVTGCRYGTPGCYGYISIINEALEVLSRFEIGGLGSLGDIGGGGVADLPPDPICDAPLRNGSTIRQNVATIENMRKSEEDSAGWSSTEQAAAGAGTFSFWLWRVRPGGKWAGRLGEPWGNLNYGATGRAANVPLGVLLRAAGAAEIGESLTGRTGSTSKGEGSPFGNSPYGDNPVGQDQIRQGYNAGC